VSNLNTNNQFATIPGWSSTSVSTNFFNIIRPTTGYVDGPGYATDGNNILDGTDETATLFQTFSIASTSELIFSADFSRRPGGGGTSSIGIYDISGTTLLSDLVEVTPPSTSSWTTGAGSLNLAAGTYQVRVLLEDWSNLDNVVVSGTTVPLPSTLLLFSAAACIFVVRFRRPKVEIEYG
jgi:hypothetical protein